MNDALSAIVERHLGSEGPLLPILHDTQRKFGHIGEDDVRQIAHMLNFSRAEVHGVVSFYHDFRSIADPRPTIELCRAEACKARGVEALVAPAKAAAGDRVTLKTVYCLGLCSVGPAARIGDALHARLNEAALVNLVEQA